MKMIFKYFSDAVIDYAFGRDDYVGIKCSLPKDYNDPFELFLGVDLEQSPDLLATYRDVVNEIPNLLTTCFSRSPVVSPMWAHYGSNHKGFVVGFDVDEVQKAFPELIIRDISYKDKPDESLVHYTEMAARRMKPRDAMHLRNAVIFHSYFSKYSEWSYEQEARVVNCEEYTEEINGISILYVPKKCVSAIIAGANSTESNQQRLTEIATQFSTAFYIEKIGRSFPTPYLVTDPNNPSVFKDGDITTPDGVCSDCSEPLRSEGELCPWCSIEEADQILAAENNPFRILDRYGLLDEYIEKFPKAPRRPYK